MKEYSFLDTVFLVNGIEISGFGEAADDTINMERVNPSASDKVGTDGEMTVNISADRRGELTFQLMQTSDSNQYLGGLVGGMENGAFVPIFVQFTDTRGGDKGSGTQGYITGPGAMVRGETANNTEWVIRVERLDLLYNGG